MQVAVPSHGVSDSEGLWKLQFQGDANAGGQWTTPQEPWACTPVALSQTVFQSGQQLEDTCLHNSILINAMDLNSIKNFMEPDCEQNF